MYGNYGQILAIDLNTGGTRIITPPKEIYAAWLGGRGLATWLLSEHNPPGIDPLDAENRLIFATGPATGTGIWGSSRYGVFTKSPLTGLYAESYSGGKAPLAVAATGYDAIMISGRSEQPAVLVVTPDGAVIHPADDLWGQDTYATQDAVHKRFGEDRWAQCRPGRHRDRDGR